MQRAHAIWLASAVLLVVYLVFEPFLSFAIFGSDTGEYFRLTSVLASTGHLPHGAGYLGWGTAYPDFPGVFLLSAAGSGALGLDPLAALTSILPVVAALSVLPLFLLFRRLFPNDTIAILGAAFATVVMPRLFSIAHPAPLALGDLLVVAGLWMFIEGRRDRRWYLPLAVTSAALIVTHHLSSYFLLVSAVGGLLLFELWRPGLWSRRFPLRELGFAGAFGVGMALYWTEYASSFRSVVLKFGLPGLPSAALPALLATGVVVTVLVSGLVIRWRRRAPRSTQVWVRLPTNRQVLKDMAVIFVAVAVGSTALAFVALPGTTQMARAATVLFFQPLLLSAVLTSGTRRYLTFGRIGLFSLTWVAALGASAIVAIGANNQVLIPGRHAEYLLIPVGFLIALGVARLVARWGDRSGRRAIVAGSVAIVVLLAANAAIAYPPPAVFAGFQEGLTNGDVALWLWVGIGIPANATVASDQRLSSMIFGVDGNLATWDSTPALFTGTSYPSALAELNRSDTPHPPWERPVNVVAVDGTMRTTGVALDPSQPALPMTSAATGWLLRPPFVPLYENGAQAVYWVVDPVTSR